MLGSDSPAPIKKRIGIFALSSYFYLKNQGLSEINSDLSALDKSVATKTVTLSVTGTSTAYGGCYQNFTATDAPISLSASKIYSVMIVAHNGIGMLYEVQVNDATGNVGLFYSQTPTSGATATLRFTYNSN